MWYVDCVRIRNYGTKNLFYYELTTMYFFLTKDGYFRKPRKLELATELKKLFEVTCPQYLQATFYECMMIIDFIEYARKFATKKAKLKTCFDLCNHLWSIFMHLSKDSTRIDIIFNLYCDKNIKGTEGSRRKRLPDILTKVIQTDQSLPVEMEKFWSVSENKVSLQKFVIEWVETN